MRRALFTKLVIVLMTVFAGVPASAVSLNNGSFEQTAEENSLPADWLYFSSTVEPRAEVTTEAANEGNRSLLLRIQPVAEAYHGVAQPFKAEAGKKYSFTVSVRVRVTDPIAPSGYGQISFEWHDESGKEIAREYGPAWGGDLSPSTWNKFTVDGIAPEMAAGGRVVVTFFAEKKPGQGAFYVDDAQLTVLEN